MSTTTKLWTWLSDANGWSYTPGTVGAADSGAWDSDYGNPLGSLKATLATKNKIGNGRWTTSGTWAAIFGIPTSATVTKVRIYSLDTRCFAFGNIDELRYSVNAGSNVQGLAYVGSQTLELWAGRQVSGLEGTWTNPGPGSLVDVPANDQAATTNVTFRLNIWWDSGSGSGTATLNHDTLVIEITYTVPPVEVAGTAPAVSTATAAILRTRNGVGLGSILALAETAALRQRDVVATGAAGASATAAASRVRDVIGSAAAQASSLAVATVVSGQTIEMVGTAAAQSSAEAVAGRIRDATGQADAVASAEAAALCTRDVAGQAAAQADGLAAAVRQRDFAGSAAAIGSVTAETTRTRAFSGQCDAVADGMAVATVTGLVGMVGLCAAVTTALAAVTIVRWGRRLRVSGMTRTSLGMVPTTRTAVRTAGRTRPEPVLAAGRGGG